MERGVVWARYYAIRSMISTLIAVGFTIASMSGGVTWGYGDAGVYDDVFVDMSMQNVEVTALETTTYSWADFCTSVWMVNQSCASATMTAGTTLLSFTVIFDAIIFLISWSFRYRTGRVFARPGTSWLGARRQCRLAQLLSLANLALRIVVLAICTNAVGDVAGSILTDTVTWSAGQILLLGAVFSTLWAHLWLWRLRRRLFLLQSQGNLLAAQQATAAAVATAVPVAVAVPVPAPAYSNPPVAANGKLPPQQVPVANTYQPAYQPGYTQQAPPPAYQQPGVAYQQPGVAYQTGAAAVPPPTSAAPAYYQQQPRV